MSAQDKQIILVVEDNDDDYFITLHAFGKNSLQNPIRRCTNGDQALDYLFRRGEFSGATTAPRPGIILLDLNLPGVDGREVLRQIKNDPELRRIPIVILTTSSAEQDVERCYNAGANSYMQKPVDLGSFIGAIGRFSDYWLNTVLLPKTAI